jgi:hypothetical protein
MTDSHWGFILAAYLVAACVLGGMSLKIVLDYRGLKQGLDKMTRTAAARDDAL